MMEKLQQWKRGREAQQSNGANRSTLQTSKRTIHKSKGEKIQNFENSLRSYAVITSKQPTIQTAIVERQENQTNPSETNISIEKKSEHEQSSDSPSNTRRIPCNNSIENEDSQNIQDISFKQSCDKQSLSPCVIEIDINKIEDRIEDLYYDFVDGRNEDTNAIRLEISQILSLCEVKIVNGLMKYGHPAIKLNQQLWYMFLLTFDLDEQAKLNAIKYLRDHKLMQEEHLTFIESNILPVFDAPIDNDDDHLESLENKDMNDIINNITNNVCNSSQEHEQKQQQEIIEESLERIDTDLLSEVQIIENEGSPSSPSKQKIVPITEETIQQTSVPQITTEQNACNFIEWLPTIQAQENKNVIIIKRNSNQEQSTIITTTSTLQPAELIIENQLHINTDVICSNVNQLGKPISRKLDYIIDLEDQDEQSIPSQDPNNRQSRIAQSNCSVNAMQQPSIFEKPNGEIEKEKEQSPDVIIIERSSKFSFGATTMNPATYPPPHMQFSTPKQKGRNITKNQFLEQNTHSIPRPSEDSMIRWMNRFSLDNQEFQSQEIEESKQQQYQYSRSDQFRRAGGYSHSFLESKPSFNILPNQPVKKDIVCIDIPSGDDDDVVQFIQEEEFNQFNKEQLSLQGNLLPYLISEEYSCNMKGGNRDGRGSNNRNNRVNQQPTINSILPNFLKSGLSLKEELLNQFQKEEEELRRSSASFYGKLSSKRVEVSDAEINLIQTSEDDSSVPCSEFSFSFSNIPQSSHEPNTRRSTQPQTSTQNSTSFISQSLQSNQNINNLFGIFKQNNSNSSNSIHKNGVVLNNNTNFGYHYIDSRFNDEPMIHEIIDDQSMCSQDISNSLQLQEIVSQLSPPRNREIPNNDNGSASKSSTKQSRRQSSRSRRSARRKQSNNSIAAAKSVSGFETDARSPVATCGGGGGGSRTDLNSSRHRRRSILGLDMNEIESDSLQNSGSSYVLTHSAHARLGSSKKSNKLGSVARVLQLQHNNNNSNHPPLYLARRSIRISNQKQTSPFSAVNHFDPTIDHSNNHNINKSRSNIEDKQPILDSQVQSQQTLSQETSTVPINFDFA